MARATHEALPYGRNEDDLVYINGEFYPRREAKITAGRPSARTGDG